ncbi:metallopeptidase family protein [Streptomyces sp. Rer75]|nr:metallopeptidase family protein [Streptomyces sp. Rer75]QLH27027.1 metallopeptidase family protein [Streptomyces sp. Rer75]
MRGPIAPPQVPLSVSRAESFIDLVQDSAERLERRWPQLSGVDFTVLEVPVTGVGGGADAPSGHGLDGHPPHGPGLTDGWDGESVPLGRFIAARGDAPDRIVIYRRPVEIRTKNRDERALLVHEVVVEQVAELLGLEPESVDPRYGQE